LRAHINNVHLNEHLECPECGDMVKYLANHLRNVHGKRKKYQCSQCEQSFIYRNNLLNHITKEHEEETSEVIEVLVDTKLEDTGEEMDIFVDTKLEETSEMDDLVDIKLEETNERKDLLEVTKLEETDEVMDHLVDIKVEETDKLMDLLVEKPAVIDRLAKQKLVLDGIGVLSCKEEEEEIFSFQSDNQSWSSVDIVDNLQYDDKVNTVKLKFR